MACWAQCSFGCQGCLWFSWDVWLASGDSVALVSQGRRQPPSVLPNTVLVIFSAAALPCGRGSCAFLPAESASRGHCQAFQNWRCKHSGIYLWAHTLVCLLGLTLPGGVRAAPSAQGPQQELERAMCGCRDQRHPRRSLMFLWGFPCGEVSTAVHLLPVESFSNLPDCTPAFLSTLHVVRLRSLSGIAIPDTTISMLVTATYANQSFPQSCFPPLPRQNCPQHSGLF